MKRLRVAVLGAGIMGSSLSLLLARRGADVTLFDKCTEPMAATSRWNEGKIHLGYLYSADPTLSTARHILPGALAFAPLLRQLIDTDFDTHATTSDDTYLVHRDSVVDAGQCERSFCRCQQAGQRPPERCGLPCRRVRRARGPVDGFRTRGSRR